MTQPTSLDVQVSERWIGDSATNHGRWFRYPTLVIKDDPDSLGNSGGVPRSALALCRSIIDRIGTEFERSGCPILRWDGRRLPETPEHIVVLNPVYLGELPQKAQDALRHEELETFKSELKSALPEVYPRSIHIGRQMGLSPAIHPNFVNLILIDDSSSAIQNLPPDRKVVFIRMLMVKIGAPKNVILPYRRNNGGGLECERVLLGTMEGGHPMLDVSEAARRLMILGSTKVVGGWTKSTESFITPDDWNRSPAVRALVGLSAYLGRHKLLSEPIVIRDWVKGERLANTIVRMLNYSRQAEGAFWALDHDMPYSDRRLPSPARGAFPLVTASGRYGTVKTEVGPEDLVAVIPTPAGGVEVVPVGDREPRGPSVEAEEFTLPLMAMDALNVAPANGLGEDGLRLVADGGVQVPPIRGGVHLHRGFLPPSSDRVVVVPTDLEAYPPVGCGVDLMHEMSGDAMRRALRLWEAGGRRAAAAVFYVPNHGTNVFVFWTADVSGVITMDPFQLFKECVDSGELRFIPNVPQV